MFRLPTLALLGTKAVGSNVYCHPLDEASLLQMPVVQNDLDATDSECRCPGYYQEECEAEAAQGCIWSSAGTSNSPWCQCDESVVPPPLPVVPQPVPIAPVTAPPAPVPNWIGVVGRDQDFTDSLGRLWHSSQTPFSTGGWGGYEQMVNGAGVQTTPSIAAFSDTVSGDLGGFDMELFQSVAHGSYSRNIIVRVSGSLCIVKFLTSEHWSSANRRFDIAINGNLVRQEYTTPANHQADILEFRDVQPSASGTITLSLLKVDAYAGDTNPMFAALEFDCEA